MLCENSRSHSGQLDLMPHPWKRTGEASFSRIMALGRRAGPGCPSYGCVTTAAVMNVLIKIQCKGILTHSRCDPLSWLEPTRMCSHITKVPQNVEAKDIKQSSEGVEVLWSDSHKSWYTWDWLLSTVPGNEKYSRLSHEADKTMWDCSIAQRAPEVSFDDVMAGNNTRGMADLTSKIYTYGLCFVAGTPKTPEATNSLLERIGPVRHTHYGGFYDFVPDLAKADTAYTNLALAAHTDTTYFTEPAGLQAFHMLSHTPPPNSTGAEGALGGQSLLVDGFNAAQLLRKESPNDYDVLRSVNIPWHASGNEGVAIAPDRAYPVLEARGEALQRVRWNNDDRGVVPLTVDVDEWYRAARKWNEILRRKQSEFWFQLEPGRVLIFDNWRVLHGRSAFEGLRRICGGYINRDDFISRWKTSNFPSQEVIGSNMQLK
ncbi:Trimethyllysine dioxygenase [Purpureocillium takamizusanense]|uniref:trimethyllysine dioxygenase n=2 Tax=Purpureocillium takamizusanense TaxID=2060973 RepID=A0A9Q8VAJ7_9HYPO|nr:Trimethyllysine dioxygenase [Purpureocillium takamizusanense]UNI18753.1 Trimethyllysine dioxygenase [Purpureocillium takamizusanense]